MNNTMKDFHKTNPEFKNVTFVWHVESLFITVMPIYLYGWKIGILIFSGLSSLLHICILLKAILAKMPEKEIK
jgi:hypothetical protein